MLGIFCCDLILADSQILNTISLYFVVLFLSKMDKLTNLRSTGIFQRCQLNLKSHKTAK